MDWLQSARLNVLRDVIPPIPDKPRIREKAIGALTAVLAKTNERLDTLMAAAR